MDKEEIVTLLMETLVEYEGCVMTPDLLKCIQADVLDILLTIGEQPEGDPLDIPLY